MALSPAAARLETVIGKHFASGEEKFEVRLHGKNAHLRSLLDELTSIGRIVEVYDGPDKTTYMLPSHIKQFDQVTLTEQGGVIRIIGNSQAHQLTPGTLGVVITEPDGDICDVQFNLHKNADGTQPIMHAQVYLTHLRLTAAAGLPTP